MLPDAFDDNASIAVFDDDRQPLTLTLAKGTQTCFGTGWTGLWSLVCGDQNSFQAASRWFGIRRYLWSSWAKIAEGNGSGALQTHLEKLWENDPIAQSLGTLVTFDAEPRLVNLGEMVLIGGNAMTQKLYTHRFETAGKRKRFQTWFLNNGSDAAERLVAYGTRKGTKALGHMLNKIANGRSVERDLLQAA